MRATTIILGMALTLALGSPVSAQSSTGDFFHTFNGINPRGVPAIDTTKALLSKKDFSKAFRTPAQTKAFGLGNVLPKVHMPSWPIKNPSTPVLSPQNNPFQPNPIFGKNPFVQNITK